MIAYSARKKKVRAAGRGCRAADRRLAALLAGVVLFGGGGCAQRKNPEGVGVAAPYGRPMTIAVAPALNFSGTSQWDPVRVGDLMASELSQVQGLNVVGVNRVMAVLARQGRDNVTSPAHAVEICELLGVDAILVFAVTEFDPYSPPVVGLAVQVYGPQPREMGFDPVATSRQARPFPGDGEDERNRPWAQVQRTYNAAHDSVVAAVEAYGKTRDAERSPMGWRKYLASQELYLRFCCHSAIEELMRQERDRVVFAGGPEEDAEP